ncbi:MAG: zinc-ribbon domain-containing protein [Actinobacteria bacterium]|nr:zinc-ribbon domain-containing protein [Actinomycetota bacterium]
MAKELGLNPKSLIKNIPNKSQSWKKPVYLWIHEMYWERNYDNKKISGKTGKKSKDVQISKYARQMSRYYHNWEVFLFNKNLLPLGRICHRRQCPSKSVDCYVPGCGDPFYLRIHSGFKYDEKIFLSSPIDNLYTSFKKSCLLDRKNELKITGSRKYPILEDAKIKCIICGRTFLFTSSEQKWYKDQGYNQPKRCSCCRKNKYVNNF